MPVRRSLPRWHLRPRRTRHERSSTGRVRDGTARAPRAPVPQVPAADPRAGRRRRAGVGRDQRLLFLPGEQGGDRRAAAREGALGCDAHPAIRRTDPAAARLRVAAADRRHRRRIAPRRVQQAPAAGPGRHRHRSARSRGARADCGVAPGDGPRREQRRPFEGAGVPEREARAALVRARVFPQGDRAVHDDRVAFRRRQRTGDDRRRESQVHLGRGVPHQDRRKGQGVRGRQAGISGGGSGHRPRPPQDQPRRSSACQGDGRIGRVRCVGDAVDRRCRNPGPDVPCRGRGAPLDGVRRAACCRGLRKTQRVDRSHGAPVAGRARRLRPRGIGAGAWNGATHSHPGRGCAAHRVRRSRPANRRAYRRRTGGPCRPVQSHDVAIARIVCGARAQGRGANAGAHQLARAADGHRGNSAGDFRVPHRRAAGARCGCRAGRASMRRAIRARAVDRRRQPSPRGAILRLR